MTLTMTTSQAHESGYAAYWDGYTAFAMDGLLDPDTLTYWKTGYKDARIEDKGK